MTTAVDAPIPAEGAAAERQRVPSARRGPRRRLFAKYAAALVGLVSLVLLINGSLNLWFSYNEATDAAVRLQREKAVAAAQRIEEFIAEIEKQIGWTTATQWASAPIEQRRFDFGRLQRQVPAITELIQLDNQGREQLKVSRLAMDVVGSGADYASDPRFTGAQGKKVWFGPVYFRKESEPYMTMAVAHSGRNAGVTVAEVNLKLIWDVITAIKIGKTGYAYVVDDKGRLIAHPDISRVLRNTDLSGLPQVEAARGSSAAADPDAIVRNLDGHRVLSASAAIPKLGWLVFVEQPLSEALAPLFTSVLQTGLLLVLGLAVAILAGLLLARRMTGPIRALDTGAARIGAGALDHRIVVRTGDELEELAERFNTMAGDLQSSYADLEKKVEDRTAELTESLDQQTATAEVLGVINSSPSDLAPVFNTILEKAHGLCGITFGTLQLYNGEKFRAVATRGFPEPQEKVIREPYEPDLTGPLQGLIDGGRFVQFSDLAERDTQVPNPRSRVAVELGIRTLLFLPLRKDSRLLGLISAGRKNAKLFSEREIALLENFAAQAVIAMENARLITETREALEQQTATAEVLGVINSSPGDLTPVFDAMLERATGLCEAAFGVLLTWDGEGFHRAAWVGAPGELIDATRDQTLTPAADSLAERFVRGEKVISIDDLVEDETYRHGAGVQALVRLGGARSYVGVALRKDDSLLGVIAIYRQEVRPFSGEQIALLQNFAAQAVIAMENARLITETREALEQQTATAEVLQVINSSPGDLAPVFDAMLDKAMHLCEAAFGILLTLDDEIFRTVAVRNVPEALADYMSKPLRPDPDTTLGRVVRERRTIHTEDNAAGEPYRKRAPLAVAAVELGHARTVLHVPLIKDEAVLGVFIIFRQEVRPFSDKQISLMQNFAAQAVIAMENVRLITELRERTHDLQESLEYQTATSEVLKVISQSGADLEPVLEMLVATAARLSEADQGYVFRLREGRHHLAASFGLTAEFKDFMLENPIGIDRGSLSGRTLLERRVVHIEDAATDPEYTWTEAQQRGHFHTGLGVPLLREDTLVGVLGLFRSRVELFTDKQIALVTTFADQAVIAIENARLFNELRARTAELGRSVDELEMLSEVGQAVSSTLDLRAVLSTILTRSVGLTGADAGAIYRYSRSERAFRQVEAVGYDEAVMREVRDMRVAEAESAMGEAVARRVPIQLADLAERPSFALRDVMFAAGFRAVLVVPLIGPERVLGAILLQRRVAGEFPPETVQLMQTLASQSVLAIQNARLFREIADKSEQLALASQHKSQFLANMSHELRTPLNAILGYAELLVDGIYGVLPDRPKGVLERIQNNGRHLLALINDVLDLAKIEAGQLTLTLEDYSLPEVVRSVVSATEPLATGKGLKFSAALQDDMPKGHGDARRLSQVLLNLVGNAIKFTDAGEVEIRGSAERGQFVLEVRDTGPGIPDADQDRIFGEFQQIDNSSTRQKGGTGLGLAISKRMVEMQGGTIAVDSALGEGSTFRVTLPVHVDEMMEAAE